MPVSKWGNERKSVTPLEAPLYIVRYLPGNIHLLALLIVVSHWLGYVVLWPVLISGRMLFILANVNGGFGWPRGVGEVEK